MIFNELPINLDEVDNNHFIYQFKILFHLTESIIMDCSMENIRNAIMYNLKERFLKKIFMKKYIENYNSQESLEIISTYLYYMLSNIVCIDFSSCFVSFIFEKFSFVKSIDSFEQEKEPFYFNIGQDLEEEENNNLINSSFYSLDNKERKDDTILDSNLHQDYGFNIKPDFLVENLFITENKKSTALESILNQNEDKKENVDYHPNEDNKDIQTLQFIGKRRGRKQKKNNNNDNMQDSHNKNYKDNIMRKIKTNLMDYILKNLNESLKNKKFSFYRLDKLISENLRRDFNIKLIKKIFNEKEETDTIDILNKKYIDIIKEIRENRLDDFLESIKKKEKNDDSTDIDHYMKLFRDLFLSYENWFINKKGRDRKTKEKKEEIPKI